ncbi:hypothetical protein [Streptomyces sp. I05A-00742]|uniref:hypothetical protein n=1 Tax=Streptomyces sp. I05A-00742 TaxID=2732853 RepID=UPI00148882A6|nr:hypothetical protein [Streptomyces sp. I05A-00742]
MPLHPWTAPATRPRGIAVHDGELTLLGAGRGPDLLHRCRASDGTLRLLEEARLTLPDGTPLTRCADVVGRGRRLYLRGRSVRQWYVLET